MSGAQLIAENADLATPPEAVEITLEPLAGASTSPGSQVILTWN